MCGVEFLYLSTILIKYYLKKKIQLKPHNDQFSQPDVEK